MEAQHDPTQTDPTSFDPIDLCDLDDDFGEAEVEQREFDPVPDGKYQVNVERVELTRTQTSKTPMLKWTFRVLGPRCRGRLLWKNSLIGTKDNLKWLKTDLTESVSPPAPPSAGTNTTRFGPFRGVIPNTRTPVYAIQ